MRFGGLDGDGAFDLLVATYTDSFDREARVFVNDGDGYFTAGAVMSLSLGTNIAVQESLPSEQSCSVEHLATQRLCLAVCLARLVIPPGARHAKRVGVVKGQGAVTDGIDLFDGNSRKLIEDAWAKVLDCWTCAEGDRTGQRNVHADLRSGRVDERKHRPHSDERVVTVFDRGTCGRCRPARESKLLHGNLPARSRRWRTTDGSGDRERSRSCAHRVHGPDRREARGSARCRASLSGNDPPPRVAAFSARAAEPPPSRIHEPRAGWEPYP